MKQDEAEKLARELRPHEIASRVTLSAEKLRFLCDHILSGAHKREIENAAFELAALVCATSDPRCNRLVVAGLLHHASAGAGNSKADGAALDEGEL